MIGRLIRPMLLALLYAALTASLTFAAPLDGQKDWQIPSIGTFSVPQEFKAAEFPDLKKLIDQQKDKLDAQAKLPIPETDEKLRPEQFDFSVYQLTMNDGQAYHLAWLMVVRDRNVLDEKMAAYFDRSPSIEQKVASIMLQDNLGQNLDKMQYNDAKSGIGFKVLEFDPFDFFRVAGKQAYAGGLRFIVNYQDFLFPFYLKGYAFSVQNHAAAVILVTTDSERAFWLPVVNNIVLSLRPVSGQK